jgi:hypothetical protein
MLVLVLPLLLGTVAAKPSCVLVDVSASNVTLEGAQQQARALKAKGAGCVNVTLGHRSFHLTRPLFLTANDSGVNWVASGADVTAAVDVPPSAWGLPARPPPLWQQPRSIDLAALFAGPSSVLYGDLSSPYHLKLLLEVQHGVWRPLVHARWPNIPFATSDAEGLVPAVNWTTVSSVPGNKSTQEKSKSFVWANNTDRPDKWVDAAAEGRLYLQGYFKYLWRDNRVKITQVDAVHRTLTTNATSGISPTGLTDGG